jgi:L,D-peptidoglycan transpeptidase YkuD (ErfK/YbiS/YcfS/YnhG family)
VSDALLTPSVSASAAAAGRSPAPRARWWLVAALTLGVVAGLALWSRAGSTPLPRPSDNGGSNALQRLAHVLPHVARELVADHANSPAATPAALWAAVDGGHLTAADQRLLRIYALTADGRADQALDAARQLSEDIPNFALAQLAYADLLTVRAGLAAQFGAVPPGQDAASAADRLKELAQEANVRVTAATTRPAPGLVPAQFAFIAKEIKHAIAVDVSRSRLYLMENTEHGLVIRADYYVSVGKLGSSKRLEGDMRTPLGIYHVTSRLPGHKLPDKYGAQALVLNYPNSYDQSLGRNGSGIWLHGVEASFYARAPLATDGCVALSNTDLNALAPYIERQLTPVLIAPSLTWVAPAQAAELEQDFKARFEAWSKARLARDVDAQKAFYATPTVPSPATVASASPGAVLEDWPTRLQKQLDTAAAQPLALNDLSVLRWDDQNPTMVVTFNESIGSKRQTHLKRQYWVRQGTQWQIIFEGAVS